MSLGNEEQNALDQFAYANNISQKTKKLYAREFLLSFSELDVCKKLPAGFDRSILSEFEDASQDRQNTAGNFSSHSFRRHEYGLSPPTRAVVGNYSLGVHGRWDGRSSGRSDRDSDSHSDRESDSGKRYGNHSRLSWPVPEHDGLLGSGSFPRSSGFAGGASAPKFRANGQYQLSRSNEPYHPPRPYKAVPQSRRATNDSYNDETFGSSDYTSEDRAEEEKKRRASFEMWRKEQQEASQEKQMKPDRTKDEFDITELMEDSKGEISLTYARKESDEILVHPSESTRSNLLPQSPASRPLVPPGFGSSISERNLAPRASNQPESLQAENSEIEDLSNSKSDLFLSRVPENMVGKQSAEKQCWIEKQHENVINLSAKCTSDKPLKSPPALDIASKIEGLDFLLHKASSPSEAFAESSGNNGITGLRFSKPLPASEISGGLSQDPSTSIIDRLFGSALTLNETHSSHPIEQREGEVDEMWASDTVRSSKFAHLFFEEEKKPVNDLSSGGPNGLLSLIQGGGKDGSQVSDTLTSDTTPSNVLFHSSQPVDGNILSNSNYSKTEFTEQLCNFNNVYQPAEISAVLTCEDLEKSMLSGSGENHSVSSVQDWSVPEVKEQQKVAVDDHASHHLLSLLQKVGTEDVSPSGNPETRTSKQFDGIRMSNFGPAPNESEMNAKEFPSSGKTLTLESLFGSAFMKELQSVGGLASLQRETEGPVGLDALKSNSLSRTADDGVRSSLMGPTTTPYESNVLPLMEGEHVKSSNQHLSSFDSKDTGGNLSHIQADKGPNFGEYGKCSDIRLPEEDSLIAASDPLNFQNLLSARNSVKVELLPSTEIPVTIPGKLATLDSIYRDERPTAASQEHPPFLHGPFDKREVEFPFRGLNVQPPSPQLHHPQSNHGSLFHPSDPRHARVNSQMNFMWPEGIIPHESPQYHQLPVNMLRPAFPHRSSAPSGFDPSMHHPPLQQVHAPGNFPPPHLQRGFPWGSPPRHATNQLPGLLQDLNPMQGFHSPRRQPNHNGIGMPPGPEAGHRGSHPEALQRLIEMELGSKSRPMNTYPFAAAAHSQGMYGHELDMGFGYR